MNRLTWLEQAARAARGVLPWVVGGLLLSIGSLVAIAEHIPPAPPPAYQFGSVLKGIYVRSELTAIASVRGSLDATGRFATAQAQIGGYYRLHPNIKLGAFYRAQTGVRHDDDWVDVQPGWQWVDARTRVEHIIAADLSPRVLLEFLPGRNWVLMAKARYEYNTFNDHQVLWLRPTLTYFVLRDREPLLNLSGGYGWDLSLNFGETTIYSRNAYFNLIYHLTERIMVETVLTRGNTIWTTSADARAEGPDRYRIEGLRTNVTVGLVYQLRQ